jgi:hypothetical protein
MTKKASLEYENPSDSNSKFKLITETGVPHRLDNVVRETTTKHEWQYSQWNYDFNEK